MPYDRSVYKSVVSYPAHRPWSSTLISAVVVACGLLYPAFWFLTIVGTGVYLFTLSQHSGKWVHAVILGAIFGSITSGASIAWFWQTLPLTWIGVPPGLIQNVIVAVTWTTTTLVLTLPHLVFAVLMVALRKQTNALIVSALLWPVLEWARMLTFALWVLAPQSVLDSYFSIAGLGNSLAESTHLLQFASLGGIYALHVVFGVLSATVALSMVALQLSSRKLLAVSVVILLAVMVTAFLLNTTPTKSSTTVRVALISLSLPAGTPPDPMRPVRALSMLALQQQRPDVIVLPEGYRLELEKNAQAYRKLFNDADILFITSGYVAEDQQSGFGSLIFESTKSGVVGSHNKTVLVPLGEYLPPALRFLYAFFDAGTLNSYFATQEERRTLSGKGVAPVVYKEVAYGALLCSEILSPYAYRALSDKGADILINAANNAWFHGSLLLYKKTVQLAKIHAVYTRKFFLTASNQSPSFVIDPRGIMVAETAWGSEIPLVYDVPIFP